MFRKLQVYEAALTEALPDGDISERERDLLERLRDSLGISPADADAIERELQKGVPSNG
jgi:tellurite resistance protein